MYMMGVMMMDVDVYNSAIVRIQAKNGGVWMPVRILADDGGWAVWVAGSLVGLQPVGTAAMRCRFKGRRQSIPCTINLHQITAPK